ncbi:MAG: TIGR00730 family Rossman fold protein [Candidatus Omnitrophota bacterium]|nr:MAG: TIGR00730 family Rossman fold protein [Candidatus Omnitrophota bacterium]
MDELVKKSTGHKDPWRVFRIMAEFVDGFGTLSEIGPAVSIFGSARKMPQDDEYYKVAEQIAYLLVKKGFAVITGGGPGIMEAANRGAKTAGGTSVGLNINISTGQKPNKFVTKLLEFRYFFCRKVMFIKYGSAFIILPGGFGTLDEFFEAVTLIQTGRSDPFPVILVGKKYWQGLLKWLNSTVKRYGNIKTEDLNIFQIVDTPEDVGKIIDRFQKKVN